MHIHYPILSSGGISKCKDVNPDVGMQGLFNNIDRAGKGFLVFKVRHNLTLAQTLRVAFSDP